MEVTKEDFKRTIESLHIQDENLFQPKCIYLPKISEVDFPPEMDFSLPVCVTREAARYVRRMLMTLNDESNGPSRDGVFMYGCPRVGKSTILYLLACVAWAKEYFFAYIKDGDEWVETRSPYVYFIQSIKRLNPPEVLRNRLGDITYKYLTEHLDARYDDLSAEIFVRFRHSMDIVLLDNGNEVLNKAKARLPFLIYRSFTQMSGNFLIWKGVIGVAATKKASSSFVPQSEDLSHVAQTQPAEEAEFDRVAEAFVPPAHGDNDVINYNKKHWLACIALQEAGGVVGIAKQAIQDLNKLKPEEVQKVQERMNNDGNSHSCSWPVIRSITKSVQTQFDMILLKHWAEKFYKRPEWEKTSCARELQCYLELSDEDRELNYLYRSDLFDLGIMTEGRDYKGRTHQVFLCTAVRWSLQKLVREELRQQDIVFDETFHGDDEFKAKILCSVEENGVTIAEQPSLKVSDIQIKRRNLNLPVPDVAFHVCGRDEKSSRLLVQNDSWKIVRMCVEFNPEVAIVLYPATCGLRLWDVSLLHKAQGVEGSSTPSYTLCFFHVKTDGSTDLKELETGGSEAARGILEQLFPGSQVEVQGQRFELTSNGNKIAEIQIRYFLVSAVKMIETSIGNLEIISGNDVKKNFHVNVDNVALTYAARTGQYKCVKLMIQEGVDVKTTDKRGNNVLFYASENGYENIVNILLHAGAHVNHTNRVGSGALKAAVVNGHDRVALLLIQAGADVNKKRKDGRRPLSEAVRYGRVKCVKLLLAAGATVNRTHGYPPPCRNGSEIQNLLDSAEVTIQTNLDLKHICREVIRKHLQQLDCLNLFPLIPMLGLPSPVCDYLLYRQEIVSDDNGDGKVDDDDAYDDDIYL